MTCNTCGEEHTLYFSCGHSRCCICQSIKREQWVDKLSAELLDVPYVHLVTTMPHDFNGLARRNQKEMYNLLFRSTSHTVNEIASNKAHLGAKTGMISVLHTFGSDMKYHVHVHSLLTFGGIDEKGNWQYPKHKKRLCRNSKFKDTFKRIFLEGLKQLFEDDKLTYHQTYDQLVAEVKDKSWSFFVTHPTMETQTIELYLARYINRVAVTNSRLEYIKATEEVHLRYNDYKNQKEGEAAPKVVRSMDPLVFINQLLMHLPPPYFQRSRRYGIHANAKKEVYKNAIEKKLKRNGRTIRTVMEIITQLMKNESFSCQQCESTDMSITQITPDAKWIYQWITLPNIRGPDPMNYILPNSNQAMF